MKKNKIISKALIVFCLMLSLLSVNINAQTITNEESIFDVESSDGIYKFSENKDIYLPFIRYAKDRILIDKNLSGFGTSFSAQSIEVNADAEGVQVLFASDSIRVNNKMEYGILFAGTNATISSEIDESLIIFSGEKITISEDAVINGDIICYSNEIEINGIINGSVIGSCSNINVNGNINKDLRIEANNLTIGDNCVNGELYIQTYNSELNLPENYANGKIKLLANEEEKFDFSIIYTAIITAAVFTLIYYIVNKISENRLLGKGLTKVKSNYILAIWGGAISLMIMPAVLIILIMLSVFGLYMIAVPALIIYFTFLLVIGLLSTLIIGSLITEYMYNSKYLKDKGTKVKYLFAFIMFIILYVFARLPYIGGYVTLLLVMLAIGTSLCMMFGKVKNQILNDIDDNNAVANK